MVNGLIDLMHGQEMSDELVLYLVSKNGDIGNVLLAKSVKNYEDNFRPIEFESDLLDGEVLVKAEKIPRYWIIRDKIENGRLITCNISGLGEIYIELINDIKLKHKLLYLADFEHDITIDSDFLVFKCESKP